LDICRFIDRIMVDPRLKKQTSDCRPLMSALPPKADIAERDWDVRFVPQPDEVQSYSASY
jgi:hypothetical protein